MKLNRSSRSKALASVVLVALIAILLFTSCRQDNANSSAVSGGALPADAAAIADARGLTPDDIDHVNAHATSTNVGDAAEVRSIITALGADRAAGVAVNATKSMHGHCIAGTGALESALTALAIHHGEIPGTINLENLDPECVGVDHVTASRKQSIDGALCSGFGFGGHNAVVALRKARG